MGDIEDKLFAEIDSVPKVKCAKCGHNKQACLFTPSQLKRKSPLCRMCRYSPKGGAK